MLDKKIAKIMKEEVMRRKAQVESQQNLYSIMGNINPIQLKKVIKRPILGLKEGKLDLGELLLASEMELSESSLLVKRMVPSVANPEVMVERV